MTTNIEQAEVTLTRAQIQDEARQVFREEHGNGVEAKPSAEVFDILLRLQREGADFHDDYTIHSLDMAEAISPIVRTYLRSNRLYWDSRKLGKGWAVNRDGQWLRCKGLMETHAPGMRLLLRAEQELREENQLRDFAVFPDGKLDRVTLKAFHGSLTRLRRSVRSYSSLLASCRDFLIEPPEWFVSRSLEWVLTICDRHGEVPKHMLVSDIGRLYERAQHPGGCGWEDLREELEDLGVIRSHSNVMKVPLADELVREAIQDAIR